MRNVLSLFDGMSCGQIALIENGMQFGTYYASEIDKHAIRQTQLNFPSTVQLGDVERWREWDLDWSSIDLILAGSPCQGFSKAGKMLAFNDPRSKLYFVFEDILNHVRSFNPNVKFLLENVKMRLEFMSVISNTLGVYPVGIDANLVSAQDRFRYYWSNIRTKRDGVLGIDVTDIPQPCDRGIVLRDIVERNVDESFYVPTPFLRNLVETPRGLSWTGKIKNYSSQNQRARKLHCKSYTLKTSSKGPGVVDETGMPRWFTPAEMLRLQSIPAWYLISCDATYRTICSLTGNGWNVAVIQHILKYYKE